MFFEQFGTKSKRMMQSALKQTILAVILKITPPELETPAQAETLIR